jgi:hypothetical protein
LRIYLDVDSFPSPPLSFDCTNLVFNAS